jgi:glycosyltransferase involved in cell wall biosynthesis
VGRPQRGQLLRDVFIDEVRPRLPDAELWLVSDRGVEGDGVKLIQRPSDEQLSSLYERAWLFCLPSRYEGFGIPYAEAMAHGTPVVASPNIGAKYVLGDGPAGLIVEDAALGQALIQVLSEADLRSELGRLGRARAAHFAWRHVVDAHEDAYAQTIASWRRR